MQRKKIFTLLMLTFVLVSGGTKLTLDSMDLASSSTQTLELQASGQEMSDSYFAELLGRISEQTAFFRPEQQSGCDGQWPCNQAKKDPRYETCDQKNDYLEKVLADSREKYQSIRRITQANQTDSSRHEQLISRECLRGAMDMKFYSNRNTTAFKKCSRPSGAPEPATRPCISSNYFDSVNNGFEMVSQCLKDYVLPGGSSSQQKDMIYSVFKMITIESGFHMNVFSGSGAGGLGQLTQGAINDVNNRDHQHLVQILTSQNSEPQCQTMAQELLVNQPKMKTSPKNACERISPANGNPLLNFIYTFAYFKQSRDTIKRSIIYQNRYFELFDLPENEKQKLASELGTWAHNTGPGGMLTPLIGLLNDYKMNGKKVTSSRNFLNELETFARAMPHPANASQARKKETSQYYRKMQQTVAEIEKNLGVRSCLQN